MTVGPQTYIVAQNPEVLAHLMRENENRIVNPSAYTTPASVFNTVAVDFDNEQECVSESPTLKTCPIPVQSLHELNPLPPPPSDEDLQNSLTEVVLPENETPLNSLQSTESLEFIQNVIPSPEPPRVVPEVLRVVSESLRVQIPIAPQSVCSQAVVEGIYDFGGANVKSCAFMKGSPAFIQLQSAVQEVSALQTQV